MKPRNVGRSVRNARGGGNSFLSASKAVRQKMLADLARIARDINKSATFKRS